ncbi:hypothetical protein KUCAC02_000620, partial [Chaenocephalus aceratus]
MEMLCRCLRSRDREGLFQQQNREQYPARGEVQLSSSHLQLVLQVERNQNQLHMDIVCGILSHDQM